jgi:hypothetical protein
MQRMWCAVALAAAVAGCSGSRAEPGVQTGAKAKHLPERDARAVVKDLSGTWGFAMDREDVGSKEGWSTKDLDARIKLPGILQGQGFGDDIGLDTPWVAALPRSDPDDPGAPFTLKRWWKLPEYEPYTHPGNIKIPYLSQPPKHYLGVAWYEKDVDLAGEWSGRRVQLVLERPHWQTTVFVDGKEVGSQRSLVAPHDYELGVIGAGKHHLAVRIDNRMSVFPGPNAKSPGYRPDGHSVSDALGATWNGVVGKIELRGTSPVFLSDVQVYPHVTATAKSAAVRVTVGNATGDPGSGAIEVGGQRAPVTWDKEGGKAELVVTLPADAPVWDEFHPNLQKLTVTLSGNGADDAREVQYGLREITHDDTKMLLNGVEVDIRGTHSGGDFPLTGYPATDVASWKDIFATCKEYGLNAMRFHSWCPPEAAFEAADEIGFYIQPECGMWNNVSNPGIPEMLEEETQRMEKAYGNHPSYLLLSAMNEPAGRWQTVLPQWAGRWAERDPRRLYSEDTGRVNLRDVGPTYAITPLRGQGGWFGGDYSRGMQNVHIPVLTHEVGQWCAYPDFDLIKKFTGYLQPGNYEIYRDSAIKHGVIDRNKEFAWASGKFQVLCYKEEIEANLRTPALAGFQLLDLHDYLGQGGALVGILDAFWESKGYVTAAEWRRFCSPTVPLARVRDRVYRTTDPLEAEVDLAHFGDKPLSGVETVWKVVGMDGKAVAQGTLGKRDFPVGKTQGVGTVKVDLSKLAAPAEYKLVVGLQGASGRVAENDWTFFLYPQEVSGDAGEVLVTQDWSAAKAKLASGGKVLFSPAAGALDDTSPPLDNVPVFWNRLMNPKLSAMLGLWVDAKSPALAEFPTEGFCDWQWANLVKNVRPVNIEKAPAGLRPIVSAIDDWARNYKLGLIFESRVGNGKLMVSGVNLAGDLSQNTVARQLRRSLLDYMNSAKFTPKVAMDEQQADALWPGKNGVRVGPIAPGANPGDIIEGPSTAPRVR